MLLKLLALLTTGFLLGIQHSLEPDHVAAVSTIVARERSWKKSALVGALWGAGHSAVLLLLGVLALVFKIQIPDVFAHYFEFAVGGMLIYLGLLLAKNIWVGDVHIHRHSHDGESHVHFHSHKQTRGHQHRHKPLLVGMLHGLAGSAGLMVLVIASMESIMEGVLLIIFFGLGSVIGMVLSGAVLALPFATLGQTGFQGRIVGSAVALVSVFFGVRIMIDNWIF